MFQQDADINIDEELNKSEQWATSTSSFSQNQLQPIFQNPNPQYNSALKDLLSPSENRYSISYSDLIGTKFSLLNRFRIMSWLKSQTDKQNYPRQILALTAYYFDLYVQKQTSISLQTVQTFSLAALLLATKITGAHFPRVSGELQKKQILEAQKQICLSLSYFLNPKTYIYYLDLLTKKWDEFVSVSQEMDNTHKYLVQSGMAFHKFRVLYERMEDVNMSGQTSKYPLNQVSFNLFFLQNSLNMQKKDSAAMNQNQLKLFIKQIYRLNNKQSQVFIAFAQFCGFKNQAVNCLNKEIGFYLSKFFMLPVQTVAPSKTAVNFDSYRRMQTVSAKGQEKLQKLIKSMKPK